MLFKFMGGGVVFVNCGWLLCNIVDCMVIELFVMLVGDVEIVGIVCVDVLCVFEFGEGGLVVY